MTGAESEHHLKDRGGCGKGIKNISNHWEFFAYKPKMRMLHFKFFWRGGRGNRFLFLDPLLVIGEEPMTLKMFSVYIKCKQTKKQTFSYVVTDWSFKKCLTCGMAKHRAISHIMIICFTALDSFDTVCDINGWQIATYLSMVNAVMVKTVAFVADSEAKPCRIHDTSPNT